jgi:hypothetical protein
MNIRNIRFKEFLEKKINELSTYKEELEYECEELERNGIDLKEYGGRYEAKRIFNAYHGTSTTAIGKAFNVTTKRDLEEFIKSRELKKLYKEIGLYNQDILSLRKAIEYYKDGEFTGYIFPNDEIIRCIYEAGINDILDLEEMKILIVSLCQRITVKNPRGNELLLTEIGISKSFDENYEIKPTENRDRVGLLFSKLVLIVQRQTDREFFLKDAELVNYIKESKPKENIIDIPIIGPDGEIKEDPNKSKVLNRVLDEDSLNLILKGYEVYNTSDDEEVKRIMIRAIKNIISQCIYIDITQDELSMHSNLDVLAERIAILRELVDAIVQKEPEAKAFLYQKNEDGVPKIMEDIHLTDPLNYDQIYKILKDLATGNVESKRGQTVIDREKIKCELIKTVNGIEFYAATFKNCSIVFSYVNGRILIHRLSNPLLNRMVAKIGYEEVEAAQKYREEEISEVAESLSEAMIIETLDLKDQVAANTFHRRK